MTAVKRVSLSQMVAETGLDTLGYSQPHKDRILIRKDLPRAVEKEVMAHEFDHIQKGEEGPFSLGGFVGDLTGGLIGESSAEKAAKSGIRRSQEATDKAIGYVDDSWDYLDESLSPYAEMGVQNMQAIQDTPDLQLQQFSFGQDDFQADPGYQFRLSEGQRGLDRIAGRNRQLTSGNRLTAAADYNSGLASQEYANAWQRAFQQTLANNSTLANQWQANIGKKQYLADTGFGATQRLSDYKYRTGVDKGNLQLGNAANATAADMFQAQNKSQFISDAMGLGASIFTGGFGGAPSTVDKFPPPSN